MCDVVWGQSRGWQAPGRPGRGDQRPNPGCARPTLITAVVFSRVRLEQVVAGGQLEGLERGVGEAAGWQTGPGGRSPGLPCTPCSRCRLGARTRRQSAPPRPGTAASGCPQ